MTNEEMLELVRKERPNQVIHKVIDFKPTEFGLISVKVDVEVIFGSKIRHTRISLPYPLEKFLELSNAEKTKWRLYILFFHK
jgi:hypothetical protein